MNDTLDGLLAGGAKNPFGRDVNGNDAPVGTSVTGVVKDIKIRQVTDINTKEPQTWPDGNPKQQAVVTLQTELRDDEEDSGERSVYIKMWGGQKEALKRASQEAKGSPAPGDTFTATFTGVGKRTNPAFNPPKIYTYQIKKGNPLDAVMSTTATPSAPAAPPQDTFPAGLTDAQKAQVNKLIGLGLEDAQIVAALDGIDATSVAALRVVAAANSGAGF